MVLATRIIVAIFWWIPFLLFIITLVPLLAIFYLYRFLITIVLSNFREDLIEPITHPDYGFSQDKFWKNPRGSIAYVHVVESPLNVDSVRARIKDALSSTASIKYKRLKELYPSFYMGYPFWKTVQRGTKHEADVDNHIKVILKDVEEDCLNDVIVKWLQSPFKKNQPLWDILLIPDLVDAGSRKSVFAFRIHHIVGDGMSMLQFLWRIFDEDLKVPTTKAKTKSLFIKLMEYSRLILFLPSSTAGFFHDFFIHRDFLSTQKSDQTLSISKTLLNLNKLKEARRVLGDETQMQSFPLHVVILFLLGEALTLMNQAKLSSYASPASFEINVAIALPKNSTHPSEDFCNHWDYTIYKVNTDPGKNRTDRLAYLSEEASWSEFNMSQSINPILTSLFSCVPRCIHNPLVETLRSTTVGLANLVGPSFPVHLCNKKILEKYAVLGPQMKNASFTIGCFSYKNDMSLTIVANNSQLSKTDTNDLLKHMHKTLAELLETKRNNATSV